MSRRYAVGVLNGNWKNKWKDDIDYWRDQRARIIEKNKNRFADVLEDLKRADPTGWEAWYDDDTNIPAVIYFSDETAINLLCDRIKQRAQEVQASHCQGAFQKIPP
jgi:hypothetical protein